MHKHKFLIFVFFILFSNNAFAQNIAYANLDKIVKESEVGKKIISYFSTKNNEIMDRIKKKETDIRKKEKSLISQKNILQDEEYNKKANSLKNEIVEFNKKSQKQIKDLNFEKDEVTKSFLIEINKILGQYANKNNIDIIFSSSQMLVGKSNLDLTQNILNDVNVNIKDFKINK